MLITLDKQEVPSTLKILIRDIFSLGWGLTYGILHIYDRASAKILEVYSLQDKGIPEQTSQTLYT